MPCFFETIRFVKIAWADFWPCRELDTLVTGGPDLLRWPILDELISQIDGYMEKQD